MVNGYGYHLPDRIIKPAKIVQTRKRVYCFLRVCRDSREAAQGVQPLVAAKPPMSVRRGSKLLSLCADKPSAERTRPQGCISAPFVPKGFILRSRLRLVFSKTPALVHSSRQAGERRRLLRRSWSWLPAQYSQRPRPGRSAGGCASGVPLGTAFAATPFPGSQAAGFSSSRPQSRGSVKSFSQIGLQTLW